MTIMDCGNLYLLIEKVEKNQQTCAVVDTSKIEKIEQGNGNDI